MIPMFTVNKNGPRRLLPFIVLTMVGLILTMSCKDEYFYDDPGTEPEWLGASIYNYLKSDGNYTNYVKLIEDLDYTEVLSRTGSKTLFVANDSAFDAFYKDNEWNVSSYSEFGTAHKKLILKFGMIDNAYLIETLSNYFSGGLHEGFALRRSSSVSFQDTIYTELAADFPNTPWWSRRGSNGSVKLFKDHTNPPLVYFFQKQMTNNSITDDDFEIFSGVDRNYNDAHVFDIKVVERDITCKNGYIHVLENVLIPRKNIAQYLEDEELTSQFSGILERFSAPSYMEEENVEYRKNHPGFTDSIFSKRYSSDRFFMSLNGAILPALPFDPGANNYASEGGALQSDMAVVFAPTNAALDEFFTNSTGAELLNVYGSREAIPYDKIVTLLERHMRNSFLQSIPSRFGTMADKENYELPVDPSDIVKSYIGVNGVVYVTKKVYPPIAYASIYAPVLISKDTKVFNWAVENNSFGPYVNSLENEFTFFVPKDVGFSTYIDPVAYQKDKPVALKFWYSERGAAVFATVYDYDKETHTIGDSTGLITSQTFVKNRLLDLLDMHLVVGSADGSDDYYFTKGGNVISVDNASGSLQVAAGGDMALGIHANSVKQFNQENGITHYLDKPLQAPLNSVYSILSTTPEFKAFFDLAAGFPDQRVFVKEYEQGGSASSGDNAADYNVAFFNTFNYTVFVPTNAAIEAAIADGLIHDWDEIEALDTIVEKSELVAQYKDELESFLRYHFQDNSVYVGMETKSGLYQTATIHADSIPSYLGTYKNKYLKLDLTVGSNSLSIGTEAKGSANVITNNNLYNIMTRDYILKGSPDIFEEADGTGSGDDFGQSAIVTSSTAVIHQIDKILTFE